jgi:hypothetical protein
MAVSGPLAAEDCQIVRSGQELPPTAPSLMQSLRALGYTTAAALADLVDNSIAASAHQIAVSYRPVPKPSLVMLDDGWGMDQGELIEAMRFGSRDPREPRGGRDLGRFGLNLNAGDGAAQNSSARSGWMSKMV